MIITAETFPNILAAMNCIDEETGRRIKDPVKEIPDRWKDYLPDIEKAIATLSRNTPAPEGEPRAPHIKPDAYLDSEFYTFCNGEFHDMRKVINRNMELVKASILLNDYFEAWTYTEDSGSRNPHNIINENRIEWLESVRAENSGSLSAEQEAELNQLRLTLT